MRQQHRQDLLTSESTTDCCDNNYTDIQTVTANDSNRQSHINAGSTATAVTGWYSLLEVNVMNSVRSFSLWDAFPRYCSKLCLLNFLTSDSKTERNAPSIWSVMQRHHCHGCLLRCPLHWGCIYFYLLGSPTICSSSPRARRKNLYHYRSTMCMHRVQLHRAYINNVVVFCVVGCLILCTLYTVVQCGRVFILLRSMLLTVL